MCWSNDVHDWLGGYPYESARDTESLMTEIGFKREKAVLRAARRGILGAGNEYVYRRI